MNRIFGKARPKVPEPTLEDASASISTRGSTVDTKIAALDGELLKYKAQLAKMKAGPAKSALMQRALRCLKQKKMYEQQRDTLYNQQANIDQTSFATQNVKETITTVAAMKSASKSLKKDLKQIKVDDVENLHYDMSDLIEDSEEINEIMGRSYGVPQELDENDLMDELNGLEDELALEDTESSSDAVPSYLVNAATAVKTNSSATEPTPSSRVEVDEYGLPKVPVRSLEV